MRASTPALGATLTEVTPRTGSPADPEAAAVADTSGSGSDEDDPAFKALVDRVVTGMMKSGEMEKLYARWFTSPIPPKGVNINYPLNAETREAFANPSDKGI